MNRRNFLKKGSLAGIAIPTLSAVPGILSAESSIIFAKPDGFSFSESSISDLQKKLEGGAITSAQLVQAYMRQILLIDKEGPTLNSIIEMNPEALTDATKLDEERKSGKVRGPLHGIPVVVKDNIDTADKMHTGAGSIALRDHIATQDAFIIQKLRDAGAIILGKTNLSEWANFRSTASSSGWSARGGQTRNPFILDRSPSGSSSGSAVAVSANLCMVAIGTETDGSIVSPSSVCGIVGLKPTVGLISRSGIIPISKTQDTAGPMARTVRDVAILLGALTGVDPGDAITSESKGKSYNDYVQFLSTDGLMGKKIGVDKKSLGTDRHIIEIFEKAINLIKGAGAQIVEVDFIDKINELSSKEFELLKYEFKSGINAYLSKTPGLIHSLTDLIKFNNNNADSEMSWFGQEIFESADALGSLDSKEYKDIYNLTHIQSKAFIDQLMKDKGLDAFCGITSGPAWVTDLLYGDSGGGVFFGTAPAITGYPHISLPTGKIHDLPVGISFFGGPYSEPVLLAIAYAYEQLTHVRTMPQFIPSLVQ